MTHPFQVEIDPDGPLPPYEQIRHQIEVMIVSGRLPEGTRLPSIRQLANDLSLAANTVARAYRELEAAGVVVTRLRNGTTVTLQARRLAEDSVRARVARAARAYVDTITSLGMSPEDAIRAVRELPADG